MKQQSNISTYFFRVFTTTKGEAALLNVDAGFKILCLRLLSLGLPFGFKHTQTHYTNYMSNVQHSYEHTGPT
jgi:hypothetical protein